MSHPIAVQIARELDLRADQIARAIELFDDDNTVPFIARYRKEVTGGLDEEQLRQIEKRRLYLRQLAERKEQVLASIQEQGKLSDELRAQIEAAETLQTVEDLYLPYKPKRRTRAMMAREKGLQPLADELLAAVKGQVGAVNLEELAARFVGEGVASIEVALQGARDIIAEQVAEDATARAETRELTAKTGFLTVTAADKTLDPTQKYELYYTYSEALDAVPPHRWLAINRGEREGVLRVHVDAPTDRILPLLEARAGLSRQTSVRQPAVAAQVHEAVQDGYKRLLAPSIEREVRGERSETADNHAVQIFAANLRALLLQPPLSGRVVMGIDPGIRTGCKVAVVDATSKVLVTTTVYPFEPRNDRRGTKETLGKLVEKLGVSIIAIGNGTASRETEALVAEVIQEAAEQGSRRQAAGGKQEAEGGRQKAEGGQQQAAGGKQEAEGGQRPAAGSRQQAGPGVMYAIVNEAGASVYSASPLARQEMPDLDVSMRGAVSIARRLQDPLAELVKIDPKSIGVGLYQHDVDQRELAATLDAVVESAVNRVGVDLNTASPALLKYVSGLTAKQAEAIVAHRDSQGPFKARQEVLKVKGVGPKAFQQAAGFLKLPDGQNPLENTPIHPESYPAVERLFSLMAVTGREKDLPQRVRAFRQKTEREAGGLAALAALVEVGEPTLVDILDSLERPGRDPREDAPPVILRQDVLSLDDLQEGMVLQGTVRNVVDFGAFVDIGIKNDGLVHISELADRFVRNPLDVVQVGDIVQVRVLKVDKQKGRVGLSMKGLKG